MSANKDTAVGGFVLGGVVLAICAVVLFGKFHFFNPPTLAAIVFEDSISGLSVGAPVAFRGVRVGAVFSIAIRFDAQSHIAYIPVIVELEPDRVQVVAPDIADHTVSLTGFIARGLRAELNTQSFVTGQSEIDLDFDPASAAVLHPGVTDLAEIPTRQSPIERVKEQLSQLPLRELADNANAALQELRTLSAQLEKTLPPLVTSLKTTADTSTTAVQAATGAIRDLQTRLDFTLGTINGLLRTGDRQLTDRGAELHKLLLSSNDTVLQAHDALANLKSITGDRGAARADLESSLHDLAAATASLRGFAADIERHPQLLLTGRK